MNDPSLYIDVSLCHDGSIEQVNVPVQRFVVQRSDDQLLNNSEDDYDLVKFLARSDLCSKKSTHSYNTCSP